MYLFSSIFNSSVKSSNPKGLQQHKFNQRVCIFPAPKLMINKKQELEEVEARRLRNFKKAVRKRISKLKKALRGEFDPIDEEQVADESE